MARYYAEATKRSQNEAIHSTAIILGTYATVTAATSMTFVDNTLS